MDDQTNHPDRPLCKCTLIPYKRMCSRCVEIEKSVTTQQAWEKRQRHPRENPNAELYLFDSPRLLDIANMAVRAAINLSRSSLMIHLFELSVR